MFEFIIVETFLVEMSSMYREVLMTSTVKLLGLVISFPSTFYFFTWSLVTACYTTSGKKKL